MDAHDLATQLKAPAFASKRARAVAVAPVAQTTLVLRLEEIKAYEHNPRRAENPEYARLVASIRSRKGLTTPLTVAKRPGEELYTVAAGGNSRLQALKELYDETGDPVFDRVTCQFEPWVSDCHVLASHLIENDVRGNMTFADKARAIVNWCELYESAHPAEAPLSQRQLAQRLGESGFQVSQTSVSRFLFAATHLMPFLPVAFDSGLGREPIERLIRLRTVAENYWRDAATGENAAAGSFERLFASVCQEQDCDRDAWIHEAFAAALARRLAALLERDAKVVTLELDALYRGMPLDSERPGDTGGDDGGWVFERERQHRRAQISGRRAHAGRDAGDANPLGSPGHKHGGSPIDTLATPPARISSHAELDSWRSQLRALARSLAERHGLGSLLKECDVGYGFFIEPPEPPSDDDLPGVFGRSNDAHASIATWLWWWLAACAQQLYPEHLASIRRRDPSAWLVQLFSGAAQYLPGTEPRAALGVLVPPPDLALLAGGFLANPGLSDADLAALHELVALTRRLNAFARQSNIPLWD